MAQQKEIDLLIVENHMSPVTQMVILLVAALAAWLPESYSRNYIEPKLANQNADLNAYLAKRKSGKYFQLGLIGVLLLIMLALFQGIIGKVEGSVILFFCSAAFFCFRFLGIRDGMRFLREKSIHVSRAGTALIILGEVVYVSCMILYYYFNALRLAVAK